MGDAVEMALLGISRAVLADVDASELHRSTAAPEALPAVRHTPRRPSKAPTQLQGYLACNARRQTFSNTREEAFTTLRLARMHEWLGRHSLTPRPRKKMTEERRAALKDCFKLMDLDGNGEIDHSECAHARAYHSI